ncbi:MAG: hypothetical protein WBW88_01335 [Rhodothermales bacterium]
MGQYAYYLVAAFALTAGVLVLGLRSDTVDADKKVGYYQVKIEARDAAQSGFHLTMRKLAADQDPWVDSTKYGFGETSYQRSTFTSSVTPFGTPVGDTVDVVVVGFHKYIDKQGVPRDTTHTIEARVVRGLVEGVPPRFRYAISTDTDLLLQGNIEVKSGFPEINASVHSNGTLRTRGNTFTVQGYGTYTGSYFETATGASNRFQPNVDWNGSADNVFQRDSVDLPNLELDRLRAAATHYETGDFSIDGDTFPYSSFAEWAAALGSTVGTGTADDPFILVVEGDLELLNRIDLDGYGMLVSASNVEVSPSGSEGSLTGGIDGYNMELGVFAAGNIDVNGNAIMKSTLYSQGRVTFHGTVDLTGGIVAKETKFIGGGSPLITYVGPGHGLTKPGFSWKDATGPIVIASAEW